SCSFLFILVHSCSFLFILVPSCSFLFLLVPSCSFFSFDLQIYHHLNNNLKVALGLSYLENSRYAEVERKFSDVVFESAEKLNHIISVDDIAVYAGLCALAEYSREGLKNLYDDSNFQSYLEQSPRVRDMISSFYTSDYAQCLSILEAFKV